MLKASLNKIKKNKFVEKQAKESRHSHREEIQMVNKYLKIYLTSVITQEI